MKGKSVLAKTTKRPMIALWLDIVEDITKEGPITPDACYARACVALGVESTNFQTGRYRKVITLLAERCRIVVEYKAGIPVLLRHNPGAA